MGPDQREVYCEYFSMVWRSLRRLGVPESLLEDAAHDVFLVLYRRWNDFEARSSFRTWVYGIVLRVAKDYRRAETRHALKLDRLARWLDSEAAAEECPAIAAEQREANRLLHTVLGQLADEQRELLVLVELEGIRVREAAQAAEITVRTCQRRLKAARAAFDAALAEHLGPTRSSTP